MKKNKIFIQNFWYVNNYGACLTAYALYKILENLGNDVSLIDVSNFKKALATNLNLLLINTVKLLTGSNHLKIYKTLTWKMLFTLQVQIKYLDLT